jgi:3-hydroxy-9,10-secoandrosta-1,3,5(10)-triene-9,17-dione monooxygenase
MGNGIEELLDRTRGLVPALKEQAAAAEQARHLLPETYDALAGAGVFKMCVPERFGGYEADFETQCDVLAAIAIGCPSSSWVATIFSAMAWLAATLPDEAQEEILGTGDPRISGGLSPTGTAAPTGGGVTLNGAWPYNTGNFGATWTVVNALRPVPDGDGAVPTCVVVPCRDLTALDDWHASGMAATGSCTVVAEDVFVPEHRTYPLPLMIESQYPADRHNATNPYFNLPLATMLIVNAAGTPAGIARGAYESFMERLPGRAITYTAYDDKAAAPVTHLQVGEAAMRIESADAHMRRAAALLDDHPAVPLTLEQRVRARAHVSHSTGEARAAVDLLFFASGASSIQQHVPIQRYQRDIQALANHALMHPQTAIELYGRVLCGLEPNTPIY